MKLKLKLPTELPNKYKRKSMKQRLPPQVIKERNHSREERLHTWISTELYDKFKDKVKLSNQYRKKNNRPQLTMQDHVRQLITQWVGDHQLRPAHYSNAERTRQATQGSLLETYINPWNREETQRKGRPLTRGTTKLPTKHKPKLRNETKHRHKPPKKHTP